MLVEQIMKKKVITLQPQATIGEALAILIENHIRHIPIVDSDYSVIGIVSDRDIRDASPSIFTSNTNPIEMENKIQTIMSPSVVTVHPLDFVEDIASIFYEQEFACVPVVENNKLVGIVTEKDMLYTFIQLTGTNVQGSQIEVKVPDRPGFIPKVTAILAERNINIVSILVYPYYPDQAYKVIVLRVQTINPLPIISDLTAAEFEVLWPNTSEKLL
ncbi:acetoin utilization AcuB family protein [Radiobacillus sp. PE A8.2]|uniref:acetoin utilization AcuB family protein n=1 Tax=Radiobacillus sp. PE A8.2 TaxID=3380349 RepID=UPI00388F2514